MRSWGWLVFALGLVWLAVAFNIETSVETHSDFGPSKVENIGLIAQRSNHLLVASLTTLIGALMVILGGRKQRSQDPRRTSLPNEEAEPLPCNRDLDLDQYRLWLAKKYQISRNDLFDQYVLNKKLYKTLDDALTAAHLIEAQSLAATTSKAAALSADDVNQKAPDNQLFSIFLVFGAITVVVGAPLIFLASGQSTKRDESASLQKMLGFTPPKSLSLTEQATISMGDSLTGMCGGSPGRLFTFKTKDFPEDIVGSLDQILGPSKKTVSADPETVSTESRVYVIPNGLTLHVWASSSGKVYFCSTTGS
ncbi:MAG: hypothetical protein RL764_395 [Pseudomonadota bacterium]|jgi:hypothetical protein